MTPFLPFLSLYLNIRGLRKGPGKFFMGSWKSPGFFVSKRVGTAEYRHFCGALHWQLQMNNKHRQSLVYYVPPLGSGALRACRHSFILARLSPKMFYVHNDIFRYQDEVFHDFVEGSCADMAENHAGPGKTLLSVSKSTVLLTQI